MPHTISQYPTDTPKPVCKIKQNSGKNHQTDDHKEKKVPMTYDTVKNAAMGSGNDVVRLKKKSLSCALTI
jgi:hypothetical protein